MIKHELIAIEVTTCASCGIHFGVPEDYLQRRREDGKGFCCPNGHSLSFSDTELKKLKRELDATQRRVDLYQGWYQGEQRDHEHTRNRLRATKGALTKTKKRVAAGVCPCCNRTFQNLHRHMAGQHPDYAADDAP